MIPGTLIAGRFEIARAIDAGGMGVVYRAHDRLDRGPVAIKILRGVEPSEILRFEREGAVLAELRHPGIVRYVAHGATAAGDRYLVMEWLDGEDLKRRLLRRALTPVESLTILRRAASALAFAHARGCVHRDVKPGNLFLVGGSVGRVKLLDFGIARILDGSPLLGPGRAPSDWSAALTGAGAVLGTPGYMAPEQAQGLPTRDARADVFSLGCILYKCLTGRGPFVGDDGLSVLLKVVPRTTPIDRVASGSATERAMPRSATTARLARASAPPRARNRAHTRT